MIYRLPKTINLDVVYNQILPDLTRQYRHLTNGQRTAVSLVQTTQIYSNAIPVFAGFLDKLNSKSGIPVYLELAYSTELLKFLYTIGFFELSRHGIIEYEEEYLNGFSELKKEYSKKNKLQIFSPILKYEEHSSEKKNEIRDLLAESLKFDVAIRFFSALPKYILFSDYSRDLISIATTELVLNAQLYSYSRCYVYMQFGINFVYGKKGILLTITDVGRGFDYSLNKKDKENEYPDKLREKFYQYSTSLGIDLKKEYHFLAIMEALYYSQIQSIKSGREMNLYKLKNLLAVSSANFRIHQGNRQVVFTSERCSQCQNRDILHCVKCLWNGMRNVKNWKRSPIKKNPVVLAGVHIDIEFTIQEIKNV